MMKSEEKRTNLQTKVESFVFKFRQILKSIANPEIEKTGDEIKKFMSILVTQIGRGISSQEQNSTRRHFTAAKGTAESIAFLLELLTDNEYINIGDNAELNELLVEINSGITEMLNTGSGQRQSGMTDE
ncbi:MAG: hypothetical protein LLG37_05690 [Spirochaetia bacterium]|nr:hypothetical protein [Spirochaetia bacterium]